jgi:Phage tail protein
VADPNDWQFTYRGLTVGANTPYELTQVTGIDPPDSREDNVDRAEGDGAYTFAGYLDVRRVTLEGQIIADGQDMETLVTSWRAAFGVPSQDDLPLTFLFPGAGDIVKLVNGKPTKKHFPVDPGYSIGVATFAVEILCGDPLIYESQLRTLGSSSPALTGGFGFPFGFPFGFANTGSTGGGNVATNIGIVPTKAFIRIDTGSDTVTGPRIRNETQDKQLYFPGLTLTPGQTLDIDTRARTVLLNGTTSRYEFLDPTSQWWSIDVGANTITYASDSGTGTMTLYYQSAWV